MTDREFEILKVILDKGLLGAIALVFGYFLSRAIERYKGSQVYEQKFAEKRIEACQEIGRILTEDGIQVKSLTVLGISSMNGNAGAWQELANLKEKRNTSFEANESLLMKHVMLFPDEARRGLGKRQEESLKFFAILINFRNYAGNSEAFSEALSEARDKYLESLQALQRTIDSFTQIDPIKGNDRLLRSRRQKS